MDVISLSTVIPYATGAVMTLVVGVAGRYIWENVLRDMVTIRRITSPHDTDIDNFIDLYTEMFPDDTIDYSPEEIRLFFEKQRGYKSNRHIDSENILLFAKCRKVVVGFLFCHYYPTKRKAIISYFAVDRNSIVARSTAASKLIKKLEKILRAKKRLCDFVFFDVPRPNQCLPTDEYRESKARIQRFFQTAKTMSRNAYVLQFDYRSPKVSLADDVQERQLVLMFAQMSGEKLEAIDKSEAIDFIKFIYLDCYGDVYCKDDPNFQKYHRYLEERLASLEETLPNRVDLICNRLPRGWAI